MTAGDVAALLIYVVQGLGVLLGVGAETVLLVLYLLALHSPLKSHEHMTRVARRARSWALFLIITSGIGAVLYQLMTGEPGVLFAPAFIFKWLLIIAVLALYFAARKYSAHGVVEGLSGAHWYALFLVHTIAPVTTWAILGSLYAAWLVFFAALWGGFSLLMRGAKKSSGTIPVSNP